MNTQGRQVLTGIISFLLAAQAFAATFTVNTAADSGVGSLRYAIEQANKTVAGDTINFSLGSPYTIQPLSALPVITNALAIDGLNGYAVPTIRIDGQSVGGTPAGFTVRQTAGVLIKGLLIYNWTSTGVSYDRANGCILEASTVYSNGTAVSLLRSSFNTIGGTNAVRRNILSGNTANGIFVSAGCTNNVIQGNFIGTDSGGSNMWPNAKGIRLFGGEMTLIGGTNDVPGVLSVGNLIGGNVTDGVYLDRFSRASTIQGNFIGTDVNGMAILTNEVGIRAWQGASNLIGGAVAGARNLISGNRNHGIYLNGWTSSYNVVVGNYIGTDVTGSNALPNGVGIEVLNGARNRIGGGAPGEGNLVSGNGTDGIVISGYSGNYGATQTVIQGNFVGTDASGMLALPNGNYGIETECSETLIGGTNSGNLISGNGSDGIRVYGEGDRSTIQDNIVGLDVTGTFAISNTSEGVLVFDCYSVQVGGSVAGTRNIISGNGREGLRMWGDNAGGHVIAGNFIGTDITGSNAVGNGLDGISISESPSNRIGMAGTYGRNVISGNGQRGLYLWTHTFSNTVRNNYIGTDVSGRMALGNDGTGMNLWNAPRNAIGVASVDGENIISANDGSGISLTGTNSSYNFIVNNLIGTDVTRTNPMGNNGTGIYISQGSTNQVGGGSGGDANRVAFNTGFGIRVLNSARGNVIIGNSIFKNQLIGIGLGGDTVTTNDPLDADTGPNDLQNFPIPVVVSNNGANIIASGTLHSRASRSYRIEFFGSMNCDVLGYGEGEEMLGLLSSVGTDGSGDASFTNSVLVFDTPPPNFITMTASDEGTFDTSEFSPWIMLDSDGDGMPDGYEYIHFGGAQAGDPEGDKDSDGVFNLHEWLADTDPSDANSVTRLTDFECTLTGRYVRVMTSMHREYSAQRSSSPMNSSWTPWYSWRDGTGEWMTFQDTPERTEHYYRLKARLPTID